MDFVCFSVNNWEKRRARKQQFMLHLSLRPDVDRVLYVEPAMSVWRSLIFFRRERATEESRSRWQRAWAGRMEAVPDSGKLFIYTPLSLFPGAFHFFLLYQWNLWLINFFLRRRLRRGGFEDIVLWLYHPFDAPLLDWFKPRRASCFDWAEKWSEYFLEYQGARQNDMARQEDEIVRRADIVFVASERLQELARPLRERSFLLRDGTIPGIFEFYRGGIPGDLKDIPRPIVGYIGTFSDRMDLALLRRLSQRLSHCSFVFVGEVHTARVDIAPLSALKNIYFLGGKPYGSLPGYIAHFDVCLLPYVFDPKTSSPTKIFDYLAGGRPIVATALPELAYLRDVVVLARTPEEFVEAIERCLREGPGDSDARRQIAREHSWAKRSEEIMRLLLK